MINMAKHKNYTTSVSLSNVARNRLIALANIEEITQKDLLNKLIDKEIAQLSSKDKSNFAFILKAIEIKCILQNRSTQLCNIIIHSCVMKKAIV